MARRCALAVVLAAAVGVGAAFAAGGFSGTARSIALTADEAGYKALTGSVAAARPPADKRQGYRSGWQTSYLKGTAAKPIEAFALVYVYATNADAARAYARSCTTCKRAVGLGGIHMKFELTNRSGTPTLVNVATCQNVYVAIALSGKKAANALAQDAGALAGGVFRKAAARGMPSCASVA